MSISIFKETLHCRNNNLYLTEHESKKRPANALAGLYSNLFLAEIILKIGQQTFDAINQGRYREFDALLKNFGCQMTALDVFLLVNNPSVRLEAQAKAKKTLKKLHKIEVLYKEFADKRPSDAEKIDIKCDIKLSSNLAHLVSLKILGLINHNIVSQGAEVPITKLDKIEALTKDIFTQRKAEITQDAYKKHLHPYNKGLPIGKWIEKMQERESANSVMFIQIQAEMLDESVRGSLLDLVSGEYVKIAKATPKVVAAAQQPSGEVALRRMDNNIAVIKNKMFLGDSPREGALPVQIFFKMPEGKILCEKEVGELPLHTPVMVLEALLDRRVDRECLEKLLKKAGGVVNFANATLANVHQYTESFRFAADEKMKAALEPYQGKPYRKIFRKAQLEHMFTASVGELL